MKTFIAAALALTLFILMQIQLYRIGQRVEELSGVIQGLERDVSAYEDDEAEGEQR